MWEGSKNKHKGRDKFTPYHKNFNHGLLANLSKSPREILATERAAKAFDPPPRLASRGRSRDTSKYCYFHDDYGHDTNNCRELKKQIEEAVKSGQLGHLVKGIKKGKEKVSDTQLGKDTTPVEAPILMVYRDDSGLKRKAAEEALCGVGDVTFPSITVKVLSNDPVVIKVLISNREVNRAYLERGSSCEVIYEHCFLKLKPSIRSKRVDSKVPLVGF